MKKIIVISLLFILCESIYSQQVVPCPQCSGYGTIVTSVGPMYCPTCGGAGKVVMNPPQNQPSTEKGEVGFHAKSHHAKSHGDAGAPNGYHYQGRSVKYNGRYYKVYASIYDGKLYIFDNVDGRIRWKD